MQDQRGYVTVELDRPRRLRYDANALAELEAVTGKSMGEILALNTSELGMNLLRAILWAGLIHEDRGLLKIPMDGVRLVGSWIAPPGAEMLGRIQYLNEKIVEAFRLAFGDPEGNGVAGAQATPPLNGSPGAGPQPASLPSASAG
jgi:hypothetical protein